MVRACDVRLAWARVTVRRRTRDGGRRGEVDRRYRTFTDAWDVCKVHKTRSRVFMDVHHARSFL